MLATEGTWLDRESAGGDLRAIVQSTWIAALGLAIALGVFLCARRFGGSLANPLAPPQLVATAMAVLLLAMAVRLRLRFAAIQWLAPLTIALYAIACSFPAERTIDWLVWLGAAAVYGLVPSAVTKRSPPVSKTPSDDADHVLLQQMSRSRLSDGREVIQGTLVAEFSPGERSTSLYVAFCPAFEYLPQFEFEPVDGPDCDIKTSQLLHQGARIEVRLSRASTSPERVPVEFVATESLPTTG